MLSSVLGEQLTYHTLYEAIFSVTNPLAILERGRNLQATAM